MKKVVVVAALTTAATVVAVAALLTHWKRKSQRQWKQTQRILRKLARECATPVAVLWNVADSIAAEMESSVGSEGVGNLKCITSFASPLPFGNEKGLLYYGINLRSTNFLILRGKLGGKNESISQLQREEVSIPCNILSATSQELFEFIAAELANFVSKHKDDTNESTDTARILGFTVSNPLDQSSIKLKSFSFDDPVGKQYVIEINQSLQKHGVNMRVLALVDDTVGDLAGGRYYSKDSVVAITLGMSTNAAYIVESGDKVINMEWGNFNSVQLPVTEFDYNLDVESSNPREEKFEKLVSGKYLGEIVRRVLLKMAIETALFGDNVPPKLKTPYLLSSPDVAAMHQDTSDNHEVVGEILNAVFGVSYTTPMVREVVAEVCDIAAERGARLAGAGIIGILKKLGRIESKKSVVTIEGGLYEHYRVFRNYLHSSVWEMLGNDLSDNVVIEHSHGGSGTGAIFLAAASSHAQNDES